MSDDNTTGSTLALFGRNLVKLRDKQGWSVAELGELSGVAVDKVGQFERAEVPATLDDMRRLAGAFDVPLSTLLGFDERIDTP